MKILVIIGIMIVSCMIGAIGSLFLKKGSERFHLNFRQGIFKLAFDMLHNWKIILGLFLYVFSTVFFIALLRTQELSLLYPLTSLSYIFVTILSIWILKEKMNVYKWLGIAAIILGVVLVSL